MRIRVNKIASVTRKLELGYELILTEKIAANAGTVIAGRVLNDKTAYNTLEDVHGRMSKLKSGDIIVGALGERKALHGYEGVIPETLCPGDTINLLNLGGVMGKCISHNPNVGKPFEIEVLGQVLLHPVFQSRKGEPATIKISDQGTNRTELTCPVIMVCGACMNSGKTVAASAIVSGLTQSGMRVGAAKLTGVSLLQDILALQDYGALFAYDFTDAGYPSTNASNAADAASLIYHKLAQHSLDAVVVEMGDGIFGQYGVQQILQHPQLAKLIKMVIYCANDPAGAYGGVRELQDRYNIDADVVSGPVTDNLVGSRYIQESLGMAATNARREPKQLAQQVFQHLETSNSPEGDSHAS